MQNCYPQYIYAFHGLWFMLYDLDFATSQKTWVYACMEQLLHGITQFCSEWWKLHRIILKVQQLMHVHALLQLLMCMHDYFLMLIPLAFIAMIAPMIAETAVVIVAIDLINSNSIPMILPILSTSSLSARMSTQRDLVQNDYIVVNHLYIDFWTMQQPCILPKLMFICIAARVHVRYTYLYHILFNNLENYYSYGTYTWSVVFVHLVLVRKIVCFDKNRQWTKYKHIWPQTSPWVWSSCLMEGKQWHNNNYGLAVASP